tara:strand:- start:616 stop:927 length:312 start_codon:yes stop_codon:yes gene_type:complete
MSRLFVYDKDADIIRAIPKVLLNAQNKRHEKRLRHDDILYYMIKETGRIGITSAGLNKYNILPRSIWINGTKRLELVGKIYRMKQYIFRGHNAGKLINRWFAK